MGARIHELPHHLMRAIVANLTPIDLASFTCTCQEMRKLLGYEVQKLGPYITTGEYLEPTCSVRMHPAIVAMLETRVSKMQEFWSERVAQQNVVLKTSQFQPKETQGLPAIPNACSITIQVDTPCNLCLSSALRYASTNISHKTYICLSDEYMVCPLQDQHLQNLKEFTGHLYIVNQPYVTDSGIMHLKKVKSLNISGCTSVYGRSIVQLMTHYALCHVDITLCGKPSVMLECHMHLWRMTQQGYASVW